MTIAKLTIPWDTWKAIADEPRNANFGRYHVVDGEDERSAWCGNSIIQYRSHIDVDTLTDWNDNYLGDSTVAANDNDAIARLIGLHPPSPPLTEDDKPIVVMYPATEGFNTYLTGRGDDIAGGVRGKGTRLKFNWTAAEAGTGGTDPEKTIEIQFLEPVEAHDGRALFGATESEWNSGDDWVSFTARMPMTPHTAAAGDGWVNKVPTGLGFDIFVPAAGDGNANVNLDDAVPVPNKTKTGYWDVDHFSGAITPNVTGTGNCDLFQLEITSTLLNEVPIGEGHRTFDIDVYKSEWFHPNWFLGITAYKGTAGAGWLTAWMFLFRENTQVG